MMKFFDQTNDVVFGGIGKPGKVTAVIVALVALGLFCTGVYYVAASCF